jgi:hypothetical protein
LSSNANLTKPTGEGPKAPTHLMGSDADTVPSGLQLCDVEGRVKEDAFYKILMEELELLVDYKVVFWKARLSVPEIKTEFCFRLQLHLRT